MKDHMVETLQGAITSTSIQVQAGNCLILIQRAMTVIGLLVKLLRKRARVQHNNYPNNWSILHILTAGEPPVSTIIVH